MIPAIAGQQLRSLLRQRVVAVLVTAVVAMTAVAGLIGWSSHLTIERVYGEAVRLLAAGGRSAPPDPFARKPPLSLLSNIAVYLSLVGGLLALVLGHLSVADEQFDGVGRLVFCRRVSRWAYVQGKLVGVATILVVALGASLAVSSVSVVVVNGTFSGAQLARLVLFFSLSWLYLVVFALVGMAATLVSRRRSLGLLWGLGIWIVFTFALPQFTSGLRPVASLNPVTDPVSTSQTFFRITAHLRPASLNEQYKTASGSILQTAPTQPASQIGLRIVSILSAGLVLWFGVGWLVGGHDYSKVQGDG